MKKRPKIKWNKIFDEPRTWEKVRDAITNLEHEIPKSPAFYESIKEARDLSCVLAVKMQDLLNDMHSVNPNLTPVRPITKIRWEQTLSGLVELVVRVCHKLPQLELNSKAA